MSTIFIWVPGPELPPELAEFVGSIPRDRNAGRDYWFDTPQEAFDACDVLRRYRVPYDLQMKTGNPWLSKSQFRICFC